MEILSVLSSPEVVAVYVASFFGILVFMRNFLIKKFRKPQPPPQILNVYPQDLFNWYDQASKTSELDAVRLFEAQYKGKYVQWVDTVTHITPGLWKRASLVFEPALNPGVSAIFDNRDDLSGVLTGKKVEVLGQLLSVDQRLIVLHNCKLLKIL